MRMNPHVSVPVAYPMALDPNGARMRPLPPIAADPNPVSPPIPIAGSPDVGQIGLRWNDFGLGRWGIFRPLRRRWLLLTRASCEQNHTRGKRHYVFQNTCFHKQTLLIFGFLILALLGKNPLFSSDLQLNFGLAVCRQGDAVTPPITCWTRDFQVPKATWQVINETPDIRFLSSPTRRIRGNYCC